MAGIEDIWTDLHWLTCVAPYRGPGVTLPLPSSLQNGTCLLSLATERYLALGTYIPVKEVSAVCLGDEAPPERWVEQVVSTSLTLLPDSELTANEVERGSGSSLSGCGRATGEAEATACDGPGDRS